MQVTPAIEFVPLYLYQKEQKEKEALKIEVMKMQLQLHKLTQMVFGGKSERFVVNPAQLTLDIKTEETAPATNLAHAKKIEYVQTDTPKKRDLSELGVYLQHLDHVYETREPNNLPAGAVKIGEDHHESR